MSDDKRRRTNHEYAALGCKSENFLMGPACSNSEQVRQWIRKHGATGEEYRVVCLIGEPIRREVEIIEKVRLVPVQEEQTDE